MLEFVGCSIAVFREETIALNIYIKKEQTKII